MGVRDLKEHLDAEQETLGLYLLPKDEALAPSAGAGAPRRSGGDGESPDEEDTPF